MLASLWLPIILAGVALFVVSFLAWMVLGLHKQDWLKIAQEDDFMRAVAECGLERGTSYMFPMCGSREEMKSEAFQRKMQAGPRGIVTVFAHNSMGQNLALTFVYYLVASFCLAYLATIGLSAGAAFMTVFRFFATAGLLVFLAALVPQAIWFKMRIVGHVVESVADAIVVGLIFAALWPA